MVETPTVLVLGAGASAHVGYPLGSGLVSELCAARGDSALADLPGWSRDDAAAFIQRLSRSGHYSIDAFLESRPGDADLGKFLLTRALKQRENLDRLFPPHSSGWYQYLFNALLVNNRPDFEKNALGIITFNYDRSLEAYLHTVLQARFDMSETRATEVLADLPIIHVHGILGDFPSTPYGSEHDPEKLLAISKKIQIIHEVQDTPDGFCNPMFERAHALLERAERIYFLGFGFHTDNVRRFRYFSPDSLKGKVVRSTDTGMSALSRQELVKRLSPFGITADAFPFNGSNCDTFFHRTATLQ